jgi:hypothetical protein
MRILRLLHPIQGLRNLSPETARDIRICSFLVLAAVLLYTPGIDWGLPPADAPGKTRPWAPDELGPIGPIVELRNTFMGGWGNPQYPLFHYIFLALFYAPYLLFSLLIGSLQHPHGGYPFGFTDPAVSVKVLLLIARSVSVLMGAGIVVAAYFTAKTLWDRTTAVLSAVFVMLMYPMFYYAKISNVDVPALFWGSLVLLLFARVLNGGLPVGRAAWMGAFAALAVATKDGSYGVFLLLPLAMLPFHYRVLQQQNRWTAWHRWKAPLVGLVVSAAVYVVMSGLALRPDKYFEHLAYIRSGSGSGRFYFHYPATLGGYWDLMKECLEHLLDSMGWPALIAAVVGIAVCLVRDRWKLTLLIPIPAIFAFVFLPVRYVELRYVMPWAYVLGFFAAVGVVTAWRAQHKLARAVAVLATGATILLGSARSFDLAYAMYRDSRYVAAAWLAQNVREGERLEFFGPMLRLRAMAAIKPGIIPVSARVTPQPGNGKLEGEFVMASAREDLEDFWLCPRWVYDGLNDGSLGYQLVANIQTPTLFELHTRQIFVNPRILIFARGDIARRFSASASSQGGSADK